MQDRATLQKQLNEAGKAYKGFLERQRNDKFFTQKQKIERKRTFLENHVDLFDEYLRGRHSRLAWDGLTRDAKDLAKDVSEEFPDSITGYKVVPTSGRRERGRVQDRKEEPVNILGADREEDSIVINEERGEIDLQGQAFKNFRNRTERKEVKRETVREGSIRETESQKGLKKGITEAQEKGIREICAWMYRNTKTHQKFVEGIAGRTPREKLLMFYIIENDKRHNVTQQDIFNSQQFVPSVEAFEKKIYFVKHWYKFCGKNINWDLIADAAATAFQAQGLLGVIGMAEGEMQNQKSGIQEIHEEEVMEGIKENSVSSDKENLLEISTGAHEDEEQKKPILLNEKDEVILPEKTGKKDVIKQAEAQIADIEARTKNLIRIQNNIAKGNNQEIVNIQELIIDLESRIERLRKFAQENSALQNMALDKDVEHPKGAAGVEKVNDVVQYHAKYMSQVTSACSTANSIISTCKKAFDNPAWTKTGSTVGLDAGFGLDSLMTLANALASVVNIMSFFKSFSSGAWEDITGKGVTALLSFANASKSGFTATRAAASIFYDASWGTSGTSNVAAGMKTGAGIAGIAIGSVTAGMGIFNMSTAGYRKSLTTETEQYLEDKKTRINNVEEPLTEEQKEAAEKEKGKNQILKNIITANRKAANRTQTSAALQTIQGGLNVASGALAMASGATVGISTIVSLGLSGAALIVGLANYIYQKKSKKKEVVDVVDRYINMDSLYKNYLDKNMAGLAGNRRQREIKKQGGESKLKENIRGEVAAVLGFPSVEKMYNYIMWQYAQTLHDLVFKKNGHYVTEEEMNGNQVDDYQDRMQYKKLIRSLGLKVAFARNGKEPVPSAAAIYKKLIA